MAEFLAQLPNPSWPPPVIVHYLQEQPGGWVCSQCTPSASQHPERNSVVLRHLYHVPSPGTGHGVSLSQGGTQAQEAVSYPGSRLWVGYPPADRR